MTTIWLKTHSMLGTGFLVASLRWTCRGTILDSTANEMTLMESSLSKVRVYQHHKTVT